MTDVLTASPADVRSHDRLFIGGIWVEPSSDAMIEVVSPSTEELLATIPDPQVEDAERAVAVARRAFDEGPWPRMAPAQRAGYLRAVADELEARSSEINRLFSIESGFPLTFSPGFLQMALAVWRDYADRIERFEFEEERSHLGARVRAVREPVGVVLAIMPWNGPMPIAALKLAPALAAGCTVVAKPAAEVPLGMYVLAEAVAAAGLPEGVVSIMPGGREVGEHLVGHPQIDKVTFTGSTAAGRRIMARCADRVARVTLELGGKSPAIIADDVEIDSTLAALLAGGLGHSGQVCCATTRVLVSEERHDELVDKLAGAMAAMKLGDPLDPATELGPLSMERQRDRVEGYIQLGREEGATIVTGGGRPAGLERGWYVEPTLFDGVDSSMRIAQEEIFGPVLSLLTYRDVDDAIRLANDTDYGLLASVYARDEALADRLARGVRAGQVNINGYGTCVVQPFGGFKQSGVGREGGPEGLDPFLEVKVLNYEPAVPLT